MNFDIFKLACELGFDVRGAELKNTIDAIMLVNEDCDKIPGFDSNKVIAYNCKKNIDTKRNSVANHLYKYVNARKTLEKICLSEINTSEIPYEYININYLVEECIELGFISRKKDIKKLYKKMY